MAQGLSSLKKLFSSQIISAVRNELVLIIDSFPFTMICICVLFIPLFVALLFSVTYFATFFFGLFSNHPLPSREIFLFFPKLGCVFSHPQDIGKGLLAYAFIGCILSSILQRDQQPNFCRHLVVALGRNWNIISCPIIFSLLFATLGEVHFSYHTTYESLAGLIPYSDANGHYAHYTKYFYDGVMGDWVLRRPMAAFLGASIHWIGGNSPTCALLLRCLLVAFAVWTSGAVMNKSFGIWSATCCVALEYAYIYKYLHTFLTEPLGFFWGCIAATLWLQSLRGKRLFWELAAYSVTLVGLLTRMGSMFLLPALFLYVLWSYRQGHPRSSWWKKPLLGLCVCTLAIGVLNATFASRGVGDHQQTGSNFSYSFAGLALGTDWSGARKHYKKQLDTLKNEKQTSRFLYKQGVNNILHSPDIFFKRLAQGEWEFLKNFNFFLFHTWYLVTLLGALLVIRRKGLFSKSAVVFWISAWLGILLSIPFIYFDDSWRVNIFVYPLIACFFSLPLAKRQLETVTDGTLIGPLAPWLAIVLSCVLLLLMTSVALIPRIHTSDPIARIQQYKASLPKQPPNRFLVDAEGMGFLVVPDGEKPNTGLPSMTWSTFRDRYHKFTAFLTRPVDETLFTEEFPKPPFVVLNQIPVIGGPGSMGFFIVPAEVLDSKNVLLWGFETSREARDASTRIPWKIVTHATPLLYK